MKYKITIIVPLLDRDLYTSIWIKENIRKDCYYIFADGSHDDKNYDVISDLKLQNVKYLRYDKDQNIGDYYKKMADASLYVKTSYIMTSDNDDFLNYKGVFECINFLENHRDYAFASGRTLCVSQKVTNNVNNKYKLDFTSYDGSNLDNLEGIEGIRKYLDSTVDKTHYVWYSIYRSEIFKNVWDSMYNCNIRDGQINELLNTCISFYHGKYKFINYCNHYIRLSNPTQSYAKKFSDNLQVRLIFNKEVNFQLIKFIDYFSMILNINKDEFFNIVKKYFYSKKQKPIYYNSLFKIFYFRALIFIFYKLVQFKSYSLKHVIKMINCYYLIKNK